MSKQNIDFLTFNRGVIDKRALSRIDIERVRQGAEIQTNYLPSILGSMAYRSGTQYITETKSNNVALPVPFVFSAQDNAIIEFTNLSYRVLIDGVAITRPSVSTAITNGSFASNITGWTDASETGAAVIHSTVYGGSARLLGASNGNRAILRQTISVASGDLNTEHGINIVLPRGKLTVRIGSSSGADNYFYGETLSEGLHSISVTPTGDIYLQLESQVDYFTYVGDVSIQTGEMALTTPFTESDLDNIRYTQSADVVYLACSGYQQRKIVRRASRTWSMEVYEPQDGPFKIENLTKTELTIGATSGNITITASAPVFNSGHVGSLLKISPSGQNVSETITAEDTFSDFIEVEGVGTGRNVVVEVTGTWAGTVTLQRSYDEGLSWEYSGARYTANINYVFNDGLDNVSILYRIGVITGDYTSGTITASLSYPRGSTDGIFRIYDVSNSTSVSAEVLQSPKSTNATEIWALGAWSEFEGYPQSITLHEGRLWFAGGNNFYGSVSDAYESFDEEIDGDSAAIVKTIGQGPVDSIYWLLSLNRLIIGTSGGQKELRSSSFDEPLTQADSTIKTISTLSASNSLASIVDTNGVFISGKRIYELSYSSDSFGYRPEDLTMLAPNISGNDSADRFIFIAVSRKPETKVHCVRDDGKVAILSYDVTENLRGWTLWETDGIVESVCVLPNANDEQDDIYYLIKRTINGVTKRYYELWAKESECIGGSINKNLDSYKSYTSPGSATLTGLSHLEGETVYVWADGQDRGSFTVSSGQIIVDATYTNIVVGLGYTAQYKSTKLAYASRAGTPLTQTKIISHIGFNLVDSNIYGFTYGRDFNNMENLPLSHECDTVDQHAIFESYDAPMIEFNATYSTDIRLCIQSNFNRPHTISAVVLGILSNDKNLETKTRPASQSE
jgi:hypothetical protein